MSSLNKVEKIEFRGNNSIFFRIWFFGVVLSLISLGIYAPWAIVNNRKYIYRNTYFVNHNFDYHADPLVILKGYIFLLIYAFILFLNYKFINPKIALLIFILTLPVLIFKILKYHINNISYNGELFFFKGDFISMYKLFILNFILNIFTIFIAFPFSMKKIYDYIYGNIQVGENILSINTRVNLFYVLYLLSLLIYITISIFLYISYFEILNIFESINRYYLQNENLFVSWKVNMIYLISSNLILLFLIFQYITHKQLKIVYNSIYIGKYKSIYTTSIFTYIIISIKNLFLIFITFGLYLPIAKLNKMKYHLSSITFECKNIN